MIKFASICPHPPIIIPTIGKKKDREKASKTIEAMNLIAQKFKSSKVKTVLIISPHGPLDFNRFTINDSPILTGHFYNFGDFKTELIFRNDLKNVKLIEKESLKENIPLRTITEKEIDHGVLVPLYFLSKTIPKIKVISLGYSGLGPKEHFEFGKIISKSLKGNIAIIASGDLSHRLYETEKGKEFDKKLLDLLKRKDIRGIINMDPDLIEEAGQCGYNSIVVLMGALTGIKWKPEILSYEGPFGVGYSVLNIKI
jgi:aromatic ring-opening dioxygenase LigB subunit